MSKICQNAGCETTCPENNCASCMAKEKRYVVKAYIRTNFLKLRDKLETDIFDEVQDFIWANCQKGYDCELIDRERDEINWAYAENFTEDTEFYEDLLMEQKEQM